MKTNKFKRAIVMLLAITMLLTSTGMASFAESMGEGADKVSTEAVVTESGSDAVQAAAEEAAAEINDEEVPEAAPAESAEPEEAKALTAKDWEAGLPDDISKDVREAMAQVAKSQLKAEGDLYKAFANAESLDNWDASFVMFVLEYANVLGVSKAIGDESKGTVDKDNISVPVNADTDKWIKSLKEKDLLTEISEEAAPEQGDIVFVKNGGETEAAVVLDADENEITVIGAYINNVGKYAADTDKVLGFVSLKDIAPEAIKEEAVEEEQAEDPADENAEAADDADKEDAEELTEEELAAKKAEEEAAAKAAEEATKAEEAGLTDQTINAELTSEPGFGGKLRSLFTSNAGTEISVSGYLPEDATVKAYPVKVEIPGKSVLAAYDITIYVPEKDENGELTGNEVVWQPEIPLSVSIKDKAIPESAEDLSVFHMENKKADPEQIGTVSAAAKSVAFEADSFSIYVVTQDADTRTYRFVENTDYVDGVWTGEYTQLRQVLENGNKLVEPTAPTKEGSLFTGWYELVDGTPSATPFNGWDTINDIPTHAEGAQPTKEEKILVAGFSPAKVKVTYYDQNESIIQIKEVTTNSTVKPNDKTDTTNYVNYVPIQDKEGSYLLFDYWTEHPYGDKEAAGTITASSDISLYPVLGEAHYIYFDGNSKAIGGTKTSYVHSLQVIPTERPAGGTGIVPTAPGYEFLGWYIKSDNTADANKYKVFNADGSLNDAGWNSLMTESEGTELTYDPTLYAHWKKGQSSYTVAYYAQKSTCEAGQTPVADDDYEFLKADTTARSADTGDSVNRSVLGNETTIINTAFDETTSNTWQKDRIGFKLSDDNNPDFVVKGDGSTVLKVYLDRKTFTMTFSYNKGQETPRTGYPRTRNDKITFADGVTADKIDALYGQSIKGKFPVNLTRSRKASRTASWVETTYTSAWDETAHSYFAAAFASTDRMPPQNVSVSLYRVMEPDKRALYYLEIANYDDESFDATDNGPKVNVNGRQFNKYVIYNNKKYELDRYLIHDFTYLTLGEEFYDIEGFEQGDANPAFSQTTTQGVPRTPGGAGETLNLLYYNRNVQKINLIDPKDSTQNRSEEFKFGESIKADDNRLRKFIPGENVEELDENHYWFYDADCKNPVDFNNLKMPNHEMTLYAGLKRTYFVEIYPDGGELGGNVNTYSTWFRLDEGEKISEYENVSRDYIKVDGMPDDNTIDTYWYDAHYANELDKDNRYAVYQPMDPEHQSGDIYIKSPGIYSFVGWFAVPADKDPMTWEIPSDIPPYNFSDEVTGTVRLKAKWQLMSQFSIVYDAGEHVHAPVDSNTYQDGANAIVKPSRSNPVGKQFRGWKVQGTTGPVYQPNGEILVSEDIATVNDDGTMTITLEAVYDEEAYKDNYTADYIFKVGDTEYYRQTLSPGEELVTPVAPSVPAGLPEGTSFTGWYEDSACAHKFSGFGAISNPVETTLYAGFAKQHTVTYYDAKKNGDDWVKGDNIIQVQKYNDGADLDTSKVIYEFDSNRYVSKWNIENESTTVNYKSSHTGYEVKSDLTLWPAMQDYLLLQYDSRGGSYVEPAKIPTDGSWPNRPKEPTRDGYQFLGWFTSPDQAYDADGHVNPDAGTEYDFNGPLPTGVTTLYAWWEPVGGKNSAEYTVIWWAQAASGDKTYEFQKSQKFTGKIGSTVDLTSSAWRAENGFDPTSVTNLVNYYDSNTTNDKSKYFEFAGTDAGAAAAVNIDPSEVSAVIHDDGSTVLNLRFNRKRSWIGFNTDGKGDIRYQTGTYDESNLYFIEAWLGREVADLWPAKRAEDTTYSKAAVLVDGNVFYNNWTPQTVESGLQAAATLQTVIDTKMMDSAAASPVYSSDKGKALIYKLTTRKDTTVVYLHYIKDGSEDTNLTQELHRGSLDNYNYPAPDNNKYKYATAYAPKELTGYVNITDRSERNPSDGGDYAGYNPIIPGSSSTGKTGQFISGSVTTTVDVYSYTQKYPNRDYCYRTRDLLGVYHYHELTVVIGGSGERYDVGLKNGNTNYTGEVYYRDSIWESYKSMSLDEFRSGEFNETLTHEDITSTDENNKHVFFFYAKRTFAVNLMNLDGTTAKETLTVPYGNLVPNELVGHDPTQAPSAGKAFVGWSVSPDTYEPFTSFMPARDITLYQIWDDIKVKVTTEGYDQNGDPISSGGTAGVYEANYNSMLRQFGVRDPKHSEPGYAFSGWEKKVVKDGETKWEPIPLSERLKDDTIIRPVWKNMHAANITYVLNGGNGSVEGTEAVEGETDHFVDSSSYLLGSKAEIKSGAALTKTEGTGADAVDYSFVCWNTKADGSGEDYYAGDSIALSKHGITLYARYVAKRKVTLVYDLNTTDTNAKFYDLNATTGKYAEAENQSKQYLLIDSGDSDSAAGKINKVYEAGKEIDDSKDETALVKFLPVRPGYTFKGWSRNSAGPADVKDGASIRVNTLENNEKTDTLYAIWEEQKLPIRVYEYEDDNISQAVLKNSGKADYHLKTATTTAQTTVQVEAAYRAQAGYSLTAGFDYEKSLVGTGDTEIDKLQYVFNDESGSYEWQYHAKDAAATTFADVASGPVRIYFHKINNGVLTVSKTVDGEYGDQTKEFTFTLVGVEGAATGATFKFKKGTEAETTIAVNGTFTLKHGESAQITLPQGKIVEITETPEDGYTTSFTCGDGASDEGDVTEDEGENAATIGKKIKLTAAEGSLSVTNDFDNDQIVPSGIAKSNMILIPLFLSLILALGIVLSIIQRRRLASRTR